MTNIDTNKIALFGIMALGLLFAFFAGDYIADENYFPIVLIFGFLFIVCLLITYGPISYLMIPVLWQMTGVMSCTPLPFNIRQLAIIFVLLSFQYHWLTFVSDMLKAHQIISGTKLPRLS